MCEFSIDQMDIISVVNRYDSLEDPEFSIPIGVTDLTGINDAMVNEKINDEEVFETMKMFHYPFVIMLNLIDNF